MQQKFYTAGEIAKISGVSTRTIRFYDSKGLLKPVKYSENGYRYYDVKSFEQLQKILMFKYLGFTLEEIVQILERSKQNNVLDIRNTMKESLKEQRQILLSKKNHIEKLIGAVEVAEQCNEVDDWNNLIGLLKILSDDEKTFAQYQNDENLQRRINIHTYSTNPDNWMHWVFEHLKIQQGMKILEIGCGNGLLWTYNLNQIPMNTTIILTDFSEGMLEATQNALNKYADTLLKRNIKISYQLADANDFNILESDFDLVIANHMLYHVSKREELFMKVTALLAKDGRFCCSTVGSHHMEELNHLAKGFCNEIQIPLDNIISAFSLENGAHQLQHFFSYVDKDLHDCDLIVDDAEMIWNYVYSYSGNAKEILDKQGKKFIEMINTQLEKEGAMYIHKSTGIFSCHM